MLASIVHVTVAIHFCGGEVAALKISFSGKLATCGMEVSEIKSLNSDATLTTHCCDDFVTFSGTDNNYIPSFLFVPDSIQNICEDQFIAAGYPIYYSDFLKLSGTNVKPPGLLMCTSVDLSDICVFRI